MLQACGEVSKVNEENMLILGKASQSISSTRPNLGAILLFHLSRKANQTRGDITCGGVITILNNALGLDLGALRPLDDNYFVSLFSSP